MAEGIFKKIVEARNINDIQCRSCGLSAYSGDCASPNAVEAVKKYGVNIENHRSSVLTQYLVLETDLFVCMTEVYAQALKKRFISNGVIYESFHSIVHSIICNRTNN